MACHGPSPRPGPSCQSSVEHRGGERIGGGQKDEGEDRVRPALATRPGPLVTAVTMWPPRSASWSRTYRWTLDDRASRATPRPATRIRSKFRRILSALPTWFEIPESVEDYVAVVDRAATIVAFLDDEDVGTFMLLGGGDQANPPCRW